MWNMTKKEETNECEKQSDTRFSGMGDGDGLLWSFLGFKARKPASFADHQGIGGPRLSP
jgi:hypothetical protein